MIVGRRSLLPAGEAPTCQYRMPGRERPSFCAARLRPGLLTRGSLTPQVSARRSRRCLRKCFPRSVGVTAGTRALVIGRLAVCARRTNADAVAITTLSIKRCSAPCKARRVAPPTRVVRAWPSGLDGASAPLSGGPLRNGHSCGCLEIGTAIRMSGIAGQTRS